MWLKPYVCVITEIYVNICDTEVNFKITILTVFPYHFLIMSLPYMAYRVF